MDNIKDTVDIETIIKPVFNFKAADIYIFRSIPVHFPVAYKA